MASATVSARGQLVIPKPLRDKYAITTKSQVEWLDFGTGLLLIPVPRDSVKASRGLFRHGPSLTKLLLEQRRQDAAREDQKIRRWRK